MAEATVAESVLPFTSDDAKTATTNVAQAVAILRAVQVAADAVEDGAVTYDFNNVTRWGPAVGAATRRVEMVRDSLLDKGDSPGADWVTSLALLEAFDYALWHGSNKGVSPGMDADDVKHMCDAVISELEILKQELAVSQ